MAYGHFTTIHAGHIRYLKHAKGLGSELIIALLDDGDDPKSPKYAFNQKEEQKP